MIPWIKKYQPKKLKDIVGQRKVVWEAISFVNKFSKAKKKAQAKYDFAGPHGTSSVRALLLYGQAGVGKTCIVQALALETGSELIELNASDFRDKESVLSILKPATEQASMFGNKKIILVDEIDGLAGRKDRGGVAATIDVIKGTNFPIICTANDPYSPKLKTLRKYCTLVELKKISTPTIANHLKKICIVEGITYEEDAIKKLATAANGDLRAAINDLQMISEKKKKITLQDIVLWGREREESVFNVLKLIFKSFDIAQALDAANNFSGDLDNLMLWVDENVPLEYRQRGELSKSYECLSDADIFLRRIMRWQHWRFLLYAQILAVAGVQQAKQSTYPRFVFHKRPELLIKLYIRAAKKRKMQGLSQQASTILHASSNRLMSSFWPYYNFIQEKNPKQIKIINQSLGL